MDTSDNDFIEDNPMAAPMQPRGDAWEQTKQKAVRVRERTEYFLRENPVPMILGALAAGVAIGMAIRYASSAGEKEKAKSRSTASIGVFSPYRSSGRSSNRLSKSVKIPLRP
jgi:hypothetical protein